MKIVLLLSVCLASASAFPLNLDWRLDKGVTRTGDIVRVTSPKGGSAAARAKIDLSAFTGKFLRATIRARGTNLERPSANWLGFKFMLSYVDQKTGERQWPGARCRVGSFDWTTVVIRRDFAAEIPTDGTLTLGLQAAGGTVEFDLSTLKLTEAAPLFAPDTGTEKCVYTDEVRNAPRLRGVMLPSRPCVEDDFRTLRDWGATMARYQMIRGWNKTNDNRDLVEFRGWLRGKLDHLDREVLPWAKKYGLKIVVDLHVPPGGRYEDRQMAMFYEKPYANAFLDCWREIATRFRGRPEIYGFDLINEPVQEDECLPNGDWYELQVRAAKIVRSIDPVTPIILESNEWDAPSSYSYMHVLGLTNVIYQAHMYVPGDFTHQGVHANGKPFKRVSYPSGRYDRDYLRRQLQAVRDFELRHQAKVYIGEFSAIAWAEGADRYLRDCISIFEEYGWDWTYHAFREWNGWSVEHEAVAPHKLRPAADTPRKRALLDGLRSRH